MPSWREDVTALIVEDLGRVFEGRRLRLLGVPTGQRGNLVDQRRLQIREIFVDRHLDIFRHRQRREQGSVLE